MKQYLDYLQHILAQSPFHYKISKLQLVDDLFSKHCFEYLDAPVQVIGSENLPAIPLNSVLEERMVPNADKVMKYYQSDTKAKGKQYSADVKKDGQSLQLIFDKDGTLIMKGPKN